MGIWPTMITPFREDGSLDEEAIGPLVDWYISRGVHGLFAVCQSSEMFDLDLEERLRLARLTLRAARGRVPVIASGHISEAREEQLRELRAMVETGVDAVILVTNRLAGAAENDAVWWERCGSLLRELPSDARLGFYECPHPYKRLFTPELLARAARTGRFTKLKDTSCDAEEIRRRLGAIRGTPLSLYNANSATLLESLGDGAAGYSGVMANFHPELYAWLWRNRSSRPEESARLAAWLGVASAVENVAYPRCAKYYLRLEGLPITTVCRRAVRELGPGDRRLIEQLRDVSRDMRRAYGV